MNELNDNETMQQNLPLVTMRNLMSLSTAKWCSFNGMVISGKLRRHNLKLPSHLMQLWW
jgi:hypothetical protein